MSVLKRNLDIVFKETTNGNDEGRRYIAKSLDGGTGWGVFDRRTKRFLKDREISQISAHDLRQNDLLN